MVFWGNASQTSLQEGVPAMHRRASLKVALGNRIESNAGVSVLLKYIPTLVCRNLKLRLGDVLLGKLSLFRILNR